MAVDFSARGILWGDSPEIFRPKFRSRDRRSAGTTSVTLTQWSLELWHEGGANALLGVGGAVAPPDITEGCLCAFHFLKSLKTSGLVLSSLTATDCRTAVSLWAAEEVRGLFRGGRAELQTAVARCGGSFAVLLRRLSGCKGLRGRVEHLRL